METRCEIRYGLERLLGACKDNQIVFTFNGTWLWRLRRSLGKSLSWCLIILGQNQPEKEREKIERKDRVHALPLLERKEEVLSQGEERARA